MSLWHTCSKKPIPDYTGRISIYLKKYSSEMMVGYLDSCHKSKDTLGSVRYMKEQHQIQVPNRECFNHHSKFSYEVFWYWVFLCYKLKY